MSEESVKIESLKQLQEVYGIADPDQELGMWNNYKPTEEHFWIFREAIRSTQRAMPAFGVNLPSIPDTKLHFLHVSKVDPLQVVYTPDKKYGKQDRHVRVKPGKYLKKFHGNKFSDETIASMVAFHRSQFAPLELKFTNDENELERVYNNGPESCMFHPAKFFKENHSAPFHPVACYAIDGTALAYAARDKRITARAIVNTTTKEYARVYGDQTNLIDLLTKAGYKQVSYLKGLKIQRVPHPVFGGFFFTPYIDGAPHKLTDRVTHLETAPDGEIYAANQSGQAKLLSDAPRYKDTWARLREDQKDLPLQVTCSWCDRKHAENVTRPIYQVGTMCPNCWKSRSSGFIEAYITPDTQALCVKDNTREIASIGKRIYTDSDIRAVFGIVYVYEKNDYFLEADVVPYSDTGRFILRAEAIDIRRRENQPLWKLQRDITAGSYKVLDGAVYSSSYAPEGAVYIRELTEDLVCPDLKPEILQNLNDARRRHQASLARQRAEAETVQPLMTETVTTSTISTASHTWITFDELQTTYTNPNNIEVEDNEADEDGNGNVRLHNGLWTPMPEAIAGGNGNWYLQSEVNENWQLSSSGWLYYPGTGSGRSLSEHVDYLAPDDLQDYIDGDEGTLSTEQAERICALVNDRLDAEQENE